MSENKANGYPRTAIFLFIIGLVIIALVLMFEPYIRREKIIDLEAACWVSFIIEIIAMIISFCSLKSRIGKVACIGSTITVLLFFMQLLSSSAPEQRKEVEIKTTPEIQRQTIKKVKATDIKE